MRGFSRASSKVLSSKIGWATDVVLHSVLPRGVVLEDYAKDLKALPDHWRLGFKNVFEAVKKDERFLYVVEEPQDHEKVILSFRPQHAIISGPGCESFAAGSLGLVRSLCRIIDCEAQGTDFPQEDYNELIDLLARARAMDQDEVAGFKSLYRKAGAGANSKAKAGGCRGKAGGARSSGQKVLSRKEMKMKKLIDNRFIGPFGPSILEKLFTHLCLPPSSVNNPKVALLLVSPTPTIWSSRVLNNYFQKSGHDPSFMADSLIKLLDHEPQKDVPFIVADGLCWNQAFPLYGGYYLSAFFDEILKSHELCNQIKNITNHYNLPPNLLVYCHTGEIAPSINWSIFLNSDFSRLELMEAWRAKFKERAIFRIHMAMGKALTIKTPESLSKAILKIRKDHKKKLKITERDGGGGVAGVPGGQVGGGYTTTTPLLIPPPTSLPEALRNYLKGFCEEFIDLVIEEAKKMIPVFLGDEKFCLKLRSSLIESALDKFDREKFIQKKTSEELTELSTEILDVYYGTEEYAEIMNLLEPKSKDLLGAGAVSSSYENESAIWTALNLDEGPFCTFIQLIDTIPPRAQHLINPSTIAIIKELKEFVRTTRSFTTEAKQIAKETFNDILKGYEAGQIGGDDSSSSAEDKRKITLDDLDQTTLFKLHKVDQFATYAYLMYGPKLKKFIHTEIEHPS